MVFFNTSIAEQTNAWFGKYHAMCREMGSVFFEFFLNQMILLKYYYRFHITECIAMYHTKYC